MPRLTTNQRLDTFKNHMNLRDGFLSEQEEVRFLRLAVKDLKKRLAKLQPIKKIAKRKLSVKNSFQHSRNED